MIHEGFSSLKLGPMTLATNIESWDHQKITFRENCFVYDITEMNKVIWYICTDQYLANSTLLCSNIISHFLS